MDKSLSNTDAFARYARSVSSSAARTNLQAGRSISFVDKDTPQGCVSRKYPDGRIEHEKVDLGKAG